MEEKKSTYINSPPPPLSYGYEQDYGYRYSNWQDNFGKILHTERMTVEEYHKKMERIFRNNEYGNQSFFSNHQYKFEKEYYILITFYNGLQERCPIGREIDKNNRCVIPKEAEERFIEIDGCIKSLKMKT